MSTEEREMLALKEKTIKRSVEFKAYQWEYLQSLKKTRGKSASDAIREMVDEDLKKQKKAELRAAAESLYDLYATDKELTISSVMDSDYIE
jgi:macrodomain Ter protein organizer (MatP/YcbG family)